MRNLKNIAIRSICGLYVICNHLNIVKYSIQHFGPERHDTSIIAIYKFARNAFAKYKLIFCKVTHNYSRTRSDMKEMFDRTGSKVKPNQGAPDREIKHLTEGVKTEQNPTSI